MATIKYQNPREKQVEIKRSGLLKKFAPILSDKLSQFKVKVSCENNGGQDIKNIKIELCKSYSSDENIGDIKKIIIGAGNFVIYPKVDDGYLLVSISLEKIDSFSGNSAKEVIVPLPKKVAPVGLVKDPLLIKKPATDQGRVYPRTPIENEKVINTDIPSSDFLDICERVRAVLSAWGFKAQRHYISVMPNKIGATINCTSEGIEEIREKFTSTYSKEKAWGKDGKKTVKVRADFDTNVVAPKEPLTNKSASWGETFASSEEEKVRIKSNGNNNGNNHDSFHRNILEPINFADQNGQNSQQQTQIQTIQNTEEMNTKKQDEIKKMIRALLVDLDIKYVSIVYGKQRKTMIANLKLKEKGLILRLDLPGVEKDGGDKSVHFNSDFAYKSEDGTLQDSSSGNKNSGSKKKTGANDILEDLFNKIREIKTGSDLSKVVEKFEEVYPGQTLWLQEGESIKKISIEVLLKKILN
ncbi:MAG: hypothetical protein KA007_02345 [Candidatus Pacebacteria bacterium]|nr:hypothetical protein [Candidatus Paceibacterota bacterium]